MDLWFLLGLLIGLSCLGWYWFYSNSALKPLKRGWRVTTPFGRPDRLRQIIANHRQTNQALQAELLDLQQLFEVAPIGFLKIDEDNQLICCNVKACQLLSIEHFKPQQPRLMLELVRSYELDALIEQTRQAQTSCQSEWLFHPVDADYAKLSRQQSRPLRGHGFPMANRCVGVFLESRAETVMLAHQRDRWIADVAHELKTPLTSIRLVAETLQARLEPPARDWVERLLGETIRLSNLVQDLLDLNQLQAHPTARLSLKPVDLARLIQSAWVSLEPLAREKHIQLDYVGPERLLIQADEARLHRVLLNLLDNSVKYSPSQQHVRVQLDLIPVAATAIDRPIPAPAVAPHDVHLEIIDAGPGFPNDALPFVFERFYRADPSRTRHSSGKSSFVADSTESALTASTSSRSPQESFLPQPNTGNGLGLAIVRQIVEAHQGTVTASNHPDTGGAWLQVFLPWQPLDEEGDGKKEKGKSSL